MKLSVLGVVLFIAGSTLMYAAVKNKDPRDVLLEALGKKAKFGMLADPSGGKAGKFGGPLNPGSGSGSGGLGPAPNPPGSVWVSV